MNNNNDRIEPKTESMGIKPVVTSKTDDDLLATPLPDESTSIQSDDAVTDELTKTTNSSDITCPSGYVQCAAQPAVPSVAEKLWNSQGSNPSMLNTEFVIHGPHKEVNCSTSGATIIDSDVEIKPLAEEKANENTNPEYDFIFCIAAIRKTAPNDLKLLAISKIDPNLKVDVKSDGSSLNGYAADHSSSSTNSTMCGHIEEPFLVPKVPRDLFVSFSSSGSSNGPVLHQTKSKSNNILLSKNVYTCPENLVCGKCDHVYPAISDNLSFDCKDIQNKSEIKTCVRRSKQKKKTKQANLNNDSNNKKSAKEINQKTEPVLYDKAAIQIEKEFKNSNKPIDTAENYVHEPIAFDIGNKVLAYWVADKLFYPAIITGIVHQKFKVEFLSDCVVKSVNVDGLVHSASLKIGSPIAIFDHISQEFRVGEIISINKVPNGEETYTIDLDSETVVVPFEKLVLDQEKARMLQDKIVTRNYDRLSKSNISEGKRTRLSRPVSVKHSQNNNTKSSKRKIIQESQQSIKKRKCLFPEESDLRNVPSTSTGITQENVFLSPSPASEDSDFDHIREHLTTINMHKLRNTDIDSEHSSPESVSHSHDPKSSGKSVKVFKDLQMILSYAKYKRIPMCNDSDQSTDNELSSKTDYFKPDKLYKKKIENVISKHGGTCHRQLNLIPKSRLKFTYIITDTPSHTCNFFLGLGLGVPCYHHKYIEQAVSQKMPFAEFLTHNKIQPIPNGCAIETREIIFRSPNTIHSKIFSGYIIYLALSGEGKSDFFAGLLRFCGAIVYTSWTNGVHMPLTRHNVVIVTDEHCPSMLVNEQVPKLSTSWVVQSLICESARPFNAHESYIAIHEVENSSS